MDVKLPKLGEGAESGVVVSLAVKEGEQITKGQTILELENEKAVAAIPSSAAGVVRKINVKTGDRISAGQVILVLDAEGAPAAEAKASGAKATPAKEERPAKPEPAQEKEEEIDEEEVPVETAADKAGFAPPASPSIRKLAREVGLDLRSVRGTDAGGRISMADIRAYIQRLQRQEARPKSQAGPTAPATASKPKPEQIDFSQWGPVTKKPFPPIRQTISRRMVENAVSIPHVTQFDEADITALTELRKKYAPEYEKKRSRLTLTSFALKAVANTLKKFPLLNCSLDETTNELVFKAYYHIGLAVDTEQGLLVPLIRDADKKNLLQLSKDIQELADKARSRKISLEEMKGGTFTISNQGGIGGGHFTPIINKPEVAILGLGRGALKPVVKDNKIEPRLMMPIALSYDHRVIDGGEAARFTVELVRAFENFREEEVRI